MEAFDSLSISKSKLLFLIAKLYEDGFIMEIERRLMKCKTGRG